MSDSQIVREVKARLRRERRMRRFEAFVFALVAFAYSAWIITGLWIQLKSEGVL